MVSPIYMTESPKAKQHKTKNPHPKTIRSTTKSNPSIHNLSTKINISLARKNHPHSLSTVGTNSENPYTHTLPEQEHKTGKSTSNNTPSLINKIP
jgi:hypothetical protein